MLRVKLIILSVTIIFTISPISGNTLLDVLDLDFILKGLQEHNTTKSCGAHVKEYVNGLASRKEWALKMYDSSANKILGKFVKRNSYINGYETCLKNEDAPADFTTQYCVLNLRVYQGENGSVVNLRPGFRLGDYPSKFFLINYGICLPRTCNYDEIESALMSHLNRTLESDPSYITLHEENCSIKQAAQLTPLDHLAIAILLLLGLTVIASTTYDMVQQFLYDNDKPHPLYKSFSLYTNFKTFTKTTDSGIRALDGMRVISCMMVTLHHNYVIMIFAPLFNLQRLYENAVDRFYLVLQYMILANDSFLFLSGFLFTNSFFNSVKEQGFYDVPRYYIHRYLRLTPSLAVLILIQSTIYRHFGEGPLWREEAKLLMDDCSKNWWTWLTYTQNYVAVTGTCMEHCWYLPLDMQLYWISPIILLPILYRPKLSAYLLTMAPLIFAFASFGVTYFYDFKVPLGELTPLKRAKEYATTHTRGAPWMVGLALGYIFYRIKDQNRIIKLSTFWVIAGWLTSALLAAGSFFGIVPFLEKQATTLESATFEGFHRMGWAMSLAWIVFACEYGYGGPVNIFLSWKAFQPIAKLSYGIYIIHVIIMRFKIMSARTPMWMGDQENMDFFITVTMVSTVLAVGLLLFVEIPFLNLDKYLFRNVKMFPLPKPPRISSVKTVTISNGKQLDELRNQKNIRRAWTSNSEGFPENIPEHIAP